MAVGPDVKLIVSTNPGSRPDVHLIGPMPSDPKAVLEVADMVLDRADSMKPGPHRTAADRLATSLMRRAGC